VAYDEQTHEFRWADATTGTNISGELIPHPGNPTANPPIPPTDLDLGIYQGDVVNVPWEGEAASTVITAGRLSVIGLDHDTVRITIVEEPWYNIGPGCHLQIFSFAFHLNLAVAGSEPFAFVLGFWAESDGEMLENAWTTLSPTTVDITGEYDGDSVSFSLDRETFAPIP